MLFPVLPNSPLSSKGVNHLNGTITLRYHHSLHLVENESFDESLIRYDSDYQNSQAFSPRFQSHLEHMADLVETHFPGGGKLVEVGCGKGDFIELIEKKELFSVTGYDTTYDGHKSNIYKCYLTEDMSIDADVVVLRHVLEHVPQPHEFLLLLKNVFGDAKIVIEVPRHEWIVEHQTFYDITYEHVNYFTKSALFKLFDDKVIQYDKVFDDQYHYVVAELSELNSAYNSIYCNDEWSELPFTQLFPDFRKNLETLQARAAHTDSVFIWGAATKGCLFLTHCKNMGILTDKVKFAIDLNPHKQNKFLPYSLIEIKSPESVLSLLNHEDIILVSNRNYLDEVKTWLSSNSEKQLNFIAL